MAGACGAHRKLRRAARLLAHVCGLALAMKRYIGKSRAEVWAQFFLSVKTCSMSELVCSRSNFSKYNLSKGFEKLKILFSIQPKQRSQENLREIQLCLEKNRSFRSLPNEIQLQLCQTAIYQEWFLRSNSFTLSNVLKYEAQSVVLRQGHVPLECCLILAGRLKVLWSNVNMNKNSNPEILSEFEEGDFMGEICLLTNANRPTSVLCETDVKLLVINKEDFCCILAQRIQDQYQETCSFLRNLPLFSSWPKDKTDFLAHCSLRRYYRANTIIIPDNLNSHFLVFIISGRCLIVAQMEDEKAEHSWQAETGSTALKNGHTGVLPTGPAGKPGRLETSTGSLKTSSSAARNTTLNMKKPQLQPFLSREKQPFHSTLAQAMLQEQSVNASGVEESPEGKEKSAAPPSVSSLEWHRLDKQIISQGQKAGGVPKLQCQGAGGTWSRTKLDQVFVPVHKELVNMEVSSPATSFVEIRVLEQGGIFGLVETLYKSCDLQLCLISEGAECVFLPKALFLAEASTECRSTAFRLAQAYPSLQAIRDCLAKQQAWDAYKARLLEPLKRGRRATGVAHPSF